MPRRILLTGLPGCGKTTVVRRVAELLQGPASGFYTWVLLIDEIGKMECFSKRRAQRILIAA